MNTRSGWPMALRLILALAVLWLSYLILASGIIHEVLIPMYRPRVLQAIESAVQSNPPNLDALVEALNGPDWLAAIIATRQIDDLYRAQKLEGHQKEKVVRALLSALASGGHWSRFGWDRDEADFAGFRSAAIETTARFGQDALLPVKDALRSSRALSREAGCWVVLTMLRNDWVDRAALANQSMLETIAGIVKRDSRQDVQAACSPVIEEINKTGPADNQDYSQIP